MLTGRTKDDDRVEGAVTANGAPASLAACRHFSTVTPQDDVLLADLTVRETLELTAELRCDRDWPRGNQHVPRRRSSPHLERIFGDI